MKCPVDGAELQMSNREGIEIDYCPKCRGVWLDRGELDKIIERSGQGAQDTDEDNPRGRRRSNRGEDDDEEGGFLGNIFGGFGGKDE
jgi:uncharacterized protein